LRTNWSAPVGPDLEAFEQEICRLPVFVDSEPRAWNMDPDLVESVLLLAELDIHAGALQPAIDALDALVTRQPGAVPAWVLLGSAHLARGDGARGVEAYRQVMALTLKDLLITVMKRGNVDGGGRVLSRG
jgi:DNA-binding SARP family transcriptional activator